MGKKRKTNPNALKRMKDETGIKSTKITKTKRAKRGSMLLFASPFIAVRG